jgi:hypothetical protein
MKINSSCRTVTNLGGVHIGYRDSGQLFVITNSASENIKNATRSSFGAHSSECLVVCRTEFGKLQAANRPDDRLKSGHFLI